MSIYEKLAKMRDEVGVIEKLGRNDHHHYKYVRAEDVTHRARELFAEHGLLLIPDCTEHRRDGTLTVVRLRFNVIDVETGGGETFDWYGEGSDKQDKGVYKAYTGGIKYFLMNLLMIPSTEDPEASSGNGSRPANEPEHRCPKCGGEMWDNRNDKRTAKSPDFKCKNKACGEAIWLDDEPVPEGVDPATGEVSDPPTSEGTEGDEPTDSPAEKVYSAQERATLTAEMRTLLDRDKNVPCMSATETRWVNDVLRQGKEANWPTVEKGIARIKEKYPELTSEKERAA